MIIPIGAPEMYRKALKEDWDRHSISERPAAEQEAFCEGFRRGWERSKQNTYQILEQIGAEDKDNV